MTRLNLLILLGLSTIIACNNGGGTSTPPPPAVPVISAVTPPKPVGSTGGWTRLHASATNEPTSFVWDFGGAGTSTDTSPNPRVFWGAPGTYTASVRASNPVGDSQPFVFSIEVREQPVRPSWQRTQIIEDPGGVGPRCLVTPSAVLIYRQADFEHPNAMLVHDRNLPFDPGNWIEYSMTVAADTFLFYGRFGVDIVARNGNIYISASSDGMLVGTTSESVPDAPDDWTFTRTLTPVQAPPTAGNHLARLTFAGDTPCLISANELPFPQELGGGFIYTMYAALANRPVPLTDDDWTIIRLPDGSGSFQQTNLTFGLTATTTPGGGVGFVQSDADQRLRYFTAPDEAAIRANQWEKTRIGSFQATGFASPREMQTADDTMILSFYQSFDRLEPYTGTLGLALSGDPTGLAANWQIAAPTGFGFGNGAKFPPISSGSIQMWGDRLVAVDADPLGLRLARALVPGLPGANDWQDHRIVDLDLNFSLDPNQGNLDDNVHTAIAVDGRDLFVVYSVPTPDENDIGLWLAVAEGSW